MTDIKEGSFVHFNGCICSIIVMAKFIAKISNDHEVACDQLCHVVIGNFLDN
jgi:hypothetical protein